MLFIGKCILVGSLAGILNGLFGAGGGLVLVPFFTHWLKLEEKQAFATSIAVILPLRFFAFALAIELSAFMPIFPIAPNLPPRLVERLEELDS